MTPQSRWIALSIFAVVVLCGCRPTPAPEAEEKPTEASPDAPTDVAPAAPAAPASGGLQKLSAEQVLEPLLPSGLCNLEFLDDQLFVGQDLSSAGTEASFAGWVGDERSRGVPANPSLRLEVDGDKTQVWDVPLVLGLKREDVVQALNEPGVVDTGFRQDVSLAGLPAGRYHLFLSYQSGEARYACDSGRFAMLGGP